MTQRDDWEVFRTVTRLRYLLIPIAALLTLKLGDCCAFVPCHPGTWIVGSVKALTDEAIPGAQVKLFGERFISKSGGCIAIHESDAIPHTLAIEANGFKPIEVPAKFGHFEVQVKLAPTNSDSTGAVTWKEVDEDAYRAAIAKRCE